MEVLSKTEHTDDGYGRQYSAKHTITITYKHPKDILFKYVHVDGKDYEDSYRNETLTIGNTEIQYHYDWGNYFVWEYVKISQDGSEKSYAEQEHGAVDPLKTKTREEETGKEVLMQLSSDLGMSHENFIKMCSSDFQINWEVLKLFGL